MSKFLNKELLRLKPYVPGEQPQDMRYIKLNTNESPFAPAPGVIKGIDDAEKSKLMLYSDPDTSALRSAIAENYGIDKNQVICTNGSDEALAFAFYAFCEKGVCFADITYGFYKVFAELYGLDYEIIPLKDDFSIDASDYFNKNKTIFIANPNAPTGLALGLSNIEKILESNKDNVVVIDEAYVDFGGESAVSLIDKYENLLVIQTFSKSRNLAGARLGIAMGNSELIADMNRVKFSFNPYNVNRLTLIAGEAAIRDKEYFEKCTEAIKETRGKTSDVLLDMGFTLTDSKTNFLFAKHPAISGADYYKKLREKGILVRHFDADRISDYVRITIGTDEQMQAFIYATKEILESL